MAKILSEAGPLNLLALEALAAAEAVAGEICLATADVSPLLVAAASQQTVPIRII
jgi:hypothetical protein